jgi:hypothetical protein
MGLELTPGNGSFQVEVYSNLGEFERSLKGPLETKALLIGLLVMDFDEILGSISFNFR